jgi:hypothetical protein
VVSGTATIFWFVFGLHLAALVFVTLLGTTATLESIFDRLMRAGLLPPAVCEACSNLALGRSPN